MGSRTFFSETKLIFEKKLCLKRIAKHRGHLFYCCIREDILPNSLQFESPIHTAAGKKLARKFGFNFLKLRINESHHWIRTYRKRDEAILQRFLKFMSDSRLTAIKLRIESMEQNIYFKLLHVIDKS